MDEPLVTIVVAQRERFAYYSTSLESIYQNTSIPFKLIYVDCDSPPHIKRHLEEQATLKGFHLIRIEGFTPPNQLHNVGQALVDTKYVVFMDNDLSVSPGWLEKLVECAEETDAWAVGPLCLEGTLEHPIVHTAGANANFRMEQGRRIFDGSLKFAKRKLADVQDQLRREPVECVEFHCFLVRNSIFGIIGPFDEKFTGISDHQDFGLAIAAAGGTIYFEPASIVAFPHVYAPLMWSDLPLFFEHWNDKRTLRNVNYMRDKWNLHDDQVFIKRMTDFSKKQRRYILRLWFPWQEYKLIRHATFPLVFILEKILHRIFRRDITDTPSTVAVRPTQVENAGALSGDKENLNAA